MSRSRASIFEDDACQPRRPAPAPPEQVRALAEGRNFTSREPQPAPARRASGARPRYRTGRTAPFSCKTTQETNDAIYAIANGRPEDRRDLERGIGPSSRSEGRKGRGRPDQGDQQLDLFTACYADIPIRDQRDTMERPFFSLAKKPRDTPIEYQRRRHLREGRPVNGIRHRHHLGRRHPDLGGHADHRGARPGRDAEPHASTSTPTTCCKAIRRADRRRPLQAAAGRLRPPALHLRRNQHPRPKGRARSRGGFHWLDSWELPTRTSDGKPTGMTMTLPDWLYEGDRRGRRRADHPRGLFPADRRHRTLAVPRGAQARRQQEIGWQLHHAPALREVRQRRPLLRLRPRRAQDRGADTLPEYALDASRTQRAKRW